MVGVIPVSGEGDAASAPLRECFSSFSKWKLALWLGVPLTVATAVYLKLKHSSDSVDSGKSPVARQEQAEAVEKTEASNVESVASVPRNNSDGCDNKGKFDITRLAALSMSFQKAVSNQ